MRTICKSNRPRIYKPKKWNVHDWNHLRNVVHGQYSDDPDGFLELFVRGRDPLLQKTRNDRSVINALMTKELSMQELAERIRLPKETIASIITNIENEGVYNLISRNGKYKILRSSYGRYGSLTLPSKGYQEIRFGLVSDTHISSKYAELDGLHMLYDVFEKEKIHDVYHCGNVLEGYKEGLNSASVINHKLDGQVQECFENYPIRKNIITRFISTDCHSGWWEKTSGVDVGFYLESYFKKHGRGDLIHLGKLEADIQYDLPNEKKFIVRLLHPGGGSAYADTHKIQKHIEYAIKNREPINMLCVGHFHKTGYTYMGGVIGLNAGCFQHATDFMKSRGLYAAIGGWIIRVRLNDDGDVISITPQFYTFDHLKRLRS